MWFVAQRRALSLPRPSAYRLYSQAKLPSMDFIRAKQREEEARIQEAEQAVADLGFPAPAIYRQKLTWGEHDQFRHVNNVHYIRWFENARFTFFELMANNLPPQMYDDVVQGRNVGVIQATNYCRYRRPAMYPDTILIGQAVQMPIVKSDRFTLKTLAYSVAQRAVVAEGLQDLVTYDYNELRKANMPPEMREAIEVWAYTGRG